MFESFPANTTLHDTPQHLIGYYFACDLSAIRGAVLVIVPCSRYAGERPQAPLLESLHSAHAAEARVAGLCYQVFVLAATRLFDQRPATTHSALSKKFFRPDISTRRIFVRLIVPLHRRRVRARRRSCTAEINLGSSI